MTCEHIITQKMINSHQKIEIKYNNEQNKFTIILNSNLRFIKNYTYLGIDAIVIQIKLSVDKIKKLYFLSPNEELLFNFDNLKN